MGVSTLHERFASTNDVTQRFTAMSQHFQEHLSSFIPFRSKDRAALTRRLQIIGVSGTATTFGAMHLGLRNYDRSKIDGLWLPTTRAAEVAGQLLKPDTDGHRNPGVGPGRAELVLSGAAILMTILETWPVERMRIADRGLREGMLYGLLQQRRMATQ
jgi:exopolyphosphatase/guanosine-5'-triphosphate,3'-diphosphate pyrophosphatase